MDKAVNILKKPLTMTLIAIFCGFVVAGIILAAVGYPPIQSLAVLIDGVFSSPKHVSNVIIKSTPLILTGLVVAFAFKTGLFNIGAEGQFIMGSVAATVVGILFDFPPVIQIPLVLLAGVLAGAVYGGIAGFLKAKFGIHEVLTSIMLNWIALYFSNYVCGLERFHKPDTIGTYAINRSGYTMILGNYKATEEGKAALGGVVSERSGVTNIGIEGMMTIGAVTGASVGYFTGSAWAGFFAAGLSGGVVALLHAFAAITCKADQTISGIAINLIGPGAALFVCRLLFDGATMSQPVPNKIPKLFGGLRVTGALQNLNVDVTVVIALLLALFLWFFLYKTKWGLHLRAVGEHPAAADTMGINVSLIRYICVLVSGVFAGFGGASMTLAIIPQFTPTAISGQGFIALAAVIFGKWTPHRAYGACLLFGAAQALTVTLGGGDFAVPSQILAMLPYMITIAILILFVGRSSAPKASGQPYEKGAR